MKKSCLMSRGGEVGPYGEGEVGCGVPPATQLGVCVVGGGGRVSGKKSSQVIRRDLSGCKQRDGE